MKQIKPSVGILFSCLLSLGTSVSADSLDSLVSPVGHPTVFEDPRNTTELRPIYLHHTIDEKFVTGGGDVNIYALQARFALSDDFSIIATKDGYVDLNPKDVVPNDEGFANIGAGVKYSVARNDTSITSLGLRYETTSGDKEVLQGLGDGAFNPFVSTAYVVDNLNLMASSGFRLRVDSSDSSFFDLNTHASYRIGNFFPLVEVGMVTVISDGDRLPIPDEGEDFFNLGASASEGKTLVTAGIGARYRICDNIDVGAIYQIPVDPRDGTRINENRVTADLIYRF